MHPPSEQRRLETLSSYDLFGTVSEPEYDQFTDLGARLFDAPICVLSLLGEHELWHKARHGVDVHSISRAVSFCVGTLTLDAPLIILDTTEDPRFADNPLVTAYPKLRFYAGAPLINADGVHLGAFCVIDTKPRESFSIEQGRLLTHLAAMITSRMEKRRASRLGRAIGGFADATSLAIVTASAEGRISFWNKAAEAMFGHVASDAIGRSLELIVPERFRQEHVAGLRRVAAGGPAKLVGKTVEVVAIRRDGTEFPIEMTLSGWDGVGGREFGAQIQDITVRREREAALQHLAHHDALTGLLNRPSFREKLEFCLRQDGAATLLACDLDGFKSVNDTLGHPVGDALLQAIALRLSTVAESEAAVARMGGDEFALLLPCRNDPIAAHEAASALLAAFEDPFHIAGHTLQIGLNIGVALAPLHATDVEELMLRADLALLASKKDGGRRFRFFDTGMNNQLAARRAFQDELRNATEQGQWELFYQPQVRLNDGRLVGAEALLRWHHPTRGLLTPAAFLDVLETHTVAYEVGSWIIDEACRQLVAWRQAGWNVPRISVNLFAAQFTAGTVERVVRAALARHSLAPGDLEIEITEKIALRPDDQVTAALQALRDAGVHIAFDDFGTGFASLTTLKQLPVSRLKIDQSFVADICEAPHSAAIVAAIVSLAERLQLEVIAEGIETEEQRVMLVKLGCHAGQGYLLGRPVRAGEFADRGLLAA